MIKRCIFSLSLLWVLNSCLAQNIPLRHDIMMEAEPCASGKSHTAWKPGNPADNTGSCLFQPDTSGKKRSLLHRKIFREPLLIYDTGGFSIQAGPLFDFSAAYETGGQGWLYTNMRGFTLTGNVAKKVYFFSNYMETQEKAPSWTEDYVEQLGTMPGNGRVKDFKGGSMDYGMASGGIAWYPVSAISIKAGHDKFFIGDGYRSLLLSDAGFNYPYLMFALDLGKFHYRTLCASLQNISEPYLSQSAQPWYRGYATKAFTAHYLGVNITEWLQAGLFESTVWPSAGGTKFQAEALNPVILYNSFRYSLFSEENVLLGLNLKIKPLPELHFYGQFVVDDFHPGTVKGYMKNKTAVQAGCKYFAPMEKIKMYLWAEYNTASPYTYAHSNPLQSYTHYNQSLAHPLGANFREAILMAAGRVKRISASMKFTYASYGTDTSGTHWGKNILLPDNLASTGYLSSGNLTGQGISETLTTAGFTIGYLINPAYSLKAETGCFIYMKNNQAENSIKALLSFGIRTSLFNIYRDF